jgi:hypothetical protein
VAAVVRRRRTDQLALFAEPICRRCSHPTNTPVCWVCIETLRSMSAWGEEWWAPVPDRDGYEVSNLGRVRSLDRVVTQRHGRRQRAKGVLLKANSDGSGYPTVNRAGPNRGRVRVHILVAHAFLGECPNGLEVCHYRDIKSDNRLCELRYDTHIANLRDAVRNGTNGMVSKTHCPAGHEYTPENTYVARRGNGRPFRQCRACARASGPARKREYRRRKREEGR